jgi:ABC-2 type transport system permease protein
MHNVIAALWAEELKMRRSKVPWIAALGFALAPLIGGLFMLILRDPAWARQWGLLTTKAQITTGHADWPAFWALLAQATAVGGMIIFGLITIWSFGREYTDRTIKDLLALPTARGTIVGAKFAMSAGWSCLGTVLVYLLGLGVGSAVDLPGWSPGGAVQAAGHIAGTAAMTIALVTPCAWVASAGRGYLPAVGALVLALVLAQIVAATGWGAYFPWSVPALGSGVAGPDAAPLSSGSYMLVGLVGLAGIAGTLAWWQWADTL